MKEKLCAVVEATEKGKKYEAIFRDAKCPCKASEEPSCGRKETKVAFGAKGMSDYTIHKDDERKERYLKRHEKNEDWNDYKSRGALSRWLLWNKKTLKASIEDFKKRFGL